MASEKNTAHTPYPTSKQEAIKSGYTRWQHEWIKENIEEETPAD